MPYKERGGWRGEVRVLHQKELQPAIDEAKKYISDPVFRQRIAEMKAER